MKPTEALKFKYWIGRVNNVTGVLIQTASINRSETNRKMAELFGGDWGMNETLSVELFELCRVKS